MFKRYLTALFAGLCGALALPAHAQKPAPRSAAATAAAASSPGVPPPMPMTAQVEESPWSHLIDSLTANLNKAPITSGILYDRALPLAALPAVNLQQADTTGNAYLSLPDW